MNTFLEKVEGMMTSILDIMDVEPGSETALTVVDEEFGREPELNTDAHHKLIELCW